MEHPFALRGHVYTHALLEAIERVPRMWTWLTDRQDYKGSAHKDTECIVLRGPGGPAIDKPFDCIQADDYWQADVVRAPMLDVLGQLQAIAPWSRLGRMMAVRLKPGGYVTPHVDEGGYADYYTSRLHVAMTESPLAFLEVGGQTQVFRQHELWQIDHKREHSARNCDTVSPRIHLIVDLLEENQDV